MCHKQRVYVIKHNEGGNFLKANNFLLTIKGWSCSFVGPSAMPTSLSKITSVYIKLNTRSSGTSLDFDSKR